MKTADASTLDLGRLTIRELLALWARTLRELHDRGVVRTFNSPIGDIAEELVSIHYGGTRGSFVQKSWDVQVGEELLQVNLGRRLLDHPLVETVELSDGALDAWSPPYAGFGA
jgi:hypothetical protein